MPSSNQNDEISNQTLLCVTVMVGGYPSQKYSKISRKICLHFPKLLQRAVKISFLLAGIRRNSREEMYQGETLVALEKAAL